MRDARRRIAEETVGILDRGWYDHPERGRVTITEEVAAAVAGTRLWTPGELRRLRPRPPSVATSVEVTNETSLSAARRLAAAGDAVGCLNFASAKNPGGGFLKGAEAQEETLARASGLYACLAGVPVFYAFHRAQADPLYSHHAIFSPAVPVFRDDRGDLLSRPYPVSFVTSAAPNAGAVDEGDPRRDLLAEVLSERAAGVLALFADAGTRGIVLGAWGCGVFRNSPEQVAAVFAAHLGPGGAFHGSFERVVFAVLDRAPGTPTYGAFAKAF
ncbi:TIGR02452 family protein [Streptosporangium fragile]|uniref:TIGR02452 family protein n=1 Tax=Streptosporangium fragile TaxID=46186 RepID=A0ABN3VXF9_9ACTN